MTAVAVKLWLLNKYWSKIDKLKTELLKRIKTKFFGQLDISNSNNLEVPMSWTNYTLWFCGSPLISIQINNFFKLLTPWSHCYFTRSYLKKMGPLQFCLLALLGIHQHPIQKYFLESCEGFLSDAPIIQKMSQALSSFVQVLIWEDKLDYLKNPSQDFKNSFCLWFLWIFSNAGRQN